MNNGKDPAKLRIRLEVPADAPIGWHTLRVATGRGVSNFRPFCVDDLPQVLKAGGNTTPAAAQKVAPPCVVCGQVGAEQTDYYQFTAQAGQRLAFEVLGRRLGSPLDPQLILRQVATGRQIAFSDDAPGQSKDPRFVHTFAEPGEYVLELRDVRYQGGADWYYRLRIGDFPLATTPVPLAARRGTTVQVQFAGPHVEGVPPVTMTVPGDAAAEAVWVAPAWPGKPSGWPVMLLATDQDETLEVEPNDDPAKAMPLKVPAAVSARLLAKGDRDHYRFAAAKGQRLLIDTQTQALHSPTSLYLVLKDAKGTQVAASNPATDPAAIDFNPPADGEYVLMVEHLHYWGGPEETYRLLIQPYQPGFTLAVAADRVEVPRGAAGVLTVQATRRDYAGPIDLTATGPGGLTGKGQIPAGQTAGLLAISAPADAAVGGQPLVILGQATINNQPVTVRATGLALVVQAMNGLAFPPRNYGADLAVGVQAAPPFRLTAQLKYPEGVRGLGVPVTVTVARDTGFDEEITLTAVTAPPAQGQQPVIPPATVKIPKGQTQATLELKPAANAPPGVQVFAIKATAKAGGQDHGPSTPLIPLPLTLPFELQVDARGGQVAPPGLPAKKGPGVFHLADLLCGAPRPVAFGPLDLSCLEGHLGRHVLKVTAVRKGGYAGPITLEVRNLPPGVTAAKATIEANQTSADVVLTTAPGTAAAEKADVNVLGTAPAAANQQNASANFTLRTGAKK
jgi:hypothetical protein